MNKKIRNGSMLLAVMMASASCVDDVALTAPTESKLDEVSMGSGC